MERDSGLRDKLSKTQSVLQPIAAKYICAYESSKETRDFFLQLKKQTKVDKILKGSVVFTTAEECEIYFRHTSTSIGFYFGNLARLNEKSWLNDDIVDVSIDEIVQYHNNSEAPVYAFSSQFYAKLTEITVGPKHSLVSRWTLNIDIFSYVCLIIPVCKGYHWSVIIVHNICKFGMVT